MCISMIWKQEKIPTEWKKGRYVQFLRKRTNDSAATTEGLPC